MVPAKNVKSLNNSGWSPFFKKMSSFFEVFLPIIPIQTFIRKFLTKADISYYCWTLITSNYFETKIKVSGGARRFPSNYMYWNTGEMIATGRTFFPYDYELTYICGRSPNFVCLIYIYISGICYMPGLPLYVAFSQENPYFLHLCEKRFVNSNSDSILVWTLEQHVIVANRMTFMNNEHLSILTKP